MKHELYLKEQEAMEKKRTESLAESLQKQKTRKEAQYMKLWQEVEVLASSRGPFMQRPLPTAGVTSDPDKLTSCFAGVALATPRSRSCFPGRQSAR